jgi:hypothetical protein
MATACEGKTTMTDGKKKKSQSKATMLAGNSELGWSKNNNRENQRTKKKKKAETDNMECGIPCVSSTPRGAPSQSSDQHTHSHTHGRRAPRKIRH